ncbi:MAG TPA: translation initiation factor IF-3 [Firmicutes bacterium]|nr:translation initiation factor IF-3 [Bacillota bacterium]
MLVIGPQGQQLGIMNRDAALKAAADENLDLLCVAPNANPPVCKILDYGKHRFEMQKKQREAKKNQHVVGIKEVQLTPQIGDHDLQVKVKGARGFLEDGNKVKVALRYRGRQLAHQENGVDTMEKFIAMVEDLATVEKRPLLEGKLLIAILASKVKK